MITPLVCTAPPLDDRAEVAPESQPPLKGSHHSHGLLLKGPVAPLSRCHVQLSTHRRWNLGSCQVRVRQHTLGTRSKITAVRRRATSAGGGPAFDPTCRR